MISLLQVAEGAKVVSSLIVYGPLGIMCAALMLAVAYLFMHIQSLRKSERETLIKMTELMTKTLTALQNNKETYDKLAELIFILNDTKQHWKNIPDINSKLEILIKLLEFRNAPTNNNN